MDVAGHLPRSGAGRALAATLVLVLVAGGLYLAWPRNGTGPAPGPTVASATPPRVPIAVSAGLPGGARAIAGLPITVSAHALAEAPVAALELWAGSDRVAFHQANVSTPALSARWSWVPEQAGRQLLVVRAVDALGRMRQSNALWVDVGTGAVASVPVARLARAPSTTMALALPAVQTSVDACAISLAVSDLASAAGFTVYQLPPSGTAFVPLTSLAADLEETSVTVPAGGGTTAFVIGAFDATVEVLGPPIIVDTPDGCADEGWAGGLAIDGGALIGGPPVDRAYLYLQQGAGAAVRVPADPSDFVESVDGILDFGGLLPSLPGTEPFSVEAWGWQGGSFVSMGSGTWSPASTGGSPSEPGPAVGIGGPLIAGGMFTALHTTVSHFVAGPDPCGSEFCLVDEAVTQDNVVWPTSNGKPSPERVLRWTTQMPQVTSIVWQVLPYAPAATADLTPPYVVDQGVLPVTPGATSGEFTIDFADYLGSQAVTAELDTADQQYAKTQAIFLPPGVETPLPPATPTPKPAGPGGLVQVPIGQILPSAITNQAYVRIIPMQGSAPLLPSNHVRFDVVPPSDPIKLDVAPGYSANKDAHTVSWTFSPPKAADPAFARCAVVTGFTADYVAPPALWPETYAVGDVKCYSPPNDDSGLLGFIEDGFEAFVDLVEDVWEGISDGYVWIQDQIVKAILIAVPCKQLADDDVCQQLAETALKVALTSMGIPPTLPDFGTVMEGLKGDLKKMIVEAASSQFPGVAEACGLAGAGAAVTDDLATCEELVNQAVDEVIEQVEAQVSAAAGAATGKAYPGVIFAPDPRGVYQVPSATLTITRTNDLPVPTQCSATVAMESVKKDHTWLELIAGWPKEASGTVSGQPFLPETFTIPPMEPGETMTRTVWLADPATWFESSDSWEYWYYYYGIANPNRAWVLLTAGSELTFEVSGNCMPSSTKGPHVLTQSATGQ